MVTVIFVNGGKLVKNFIKGFLFFILIFSSSNLFPTNDQDINIQELKQELKAEIQELKNVIKIQN